MRDGECWEQQTLAQTIRGTGYGLSPNGVDSFHTPNTTGLDGGSNSRKALKKKMERLPTPQASDHITKKTSASWKAKGGVNFSLSNPEIQAKWPTPDANCGQRGTQPNWTPKRKSGQPAQYTINQAVRDRFPTPTAHNAKECNSPSEQSKNTPTLATHAGGKLNPMWVEWLMGWPLAWTDLKPLEMDKFLSAQQQHGES
jgi:DNA (cytosine-5)-methyltransferase 1